MKTSLSPLSTLLLDFDSIYFAVTHFGPTWDAVQKLLS
jgi:hypothetical protein